jgi:DNA helicase-2/ATP-dependent DNA helicase PcrA
MVVLEKGRLPKLEVLIIDEAQDLSRLQWQLVYELVKKAQRVYIAVDDDQAVFTWAGADVKSFLEFEGDIHVLRQSYRVPASVHTLANNVVRRIKNRQSKEWRPRDYIGSVKQYYRFEDVPFDAGEWLILASTNYMLNPVHEWLKSNGILFERNHVPSLAPTLIKAVIDWEKLRKGQALGLNDIQGIYKYLGSDCVARGFKTFKGDIDVLEYTMEDLKRSYGLLTDAVWHDALHRISEDKREYLRAILRRGFKISSSNRIRLSTIHGAKGGEANNVVVLMDLSPKFSKEYAINSDNVNRLFYVAVTRTKETLHLVLPRQQDKGFRL